MTPDEAKQVILDALQSKSKSKSKFYLKDFYAMIPDMKAREVKNLVQQDGSGRASRVLVQRKQTLIGLKGMGKQHQEEDE